MTPTGLTSTYTPGTGALIEWVAVPGSVGVQLSVNLPSGAVLNKRIGAFELDQFFIPDDALSLGTYTWRVQAACSPIPPYDVTQVSVSSSFTVGSASSCPATVADLDGNIYNTTQIGSQCWMAENLKVEQYLNGDAIPTGLSSSAWATTTSGAFDEYDNSAFNKATYGLLYNWFAAVDARGLCPTGWHLPSDTEWTQLSAILGGSEAARGGKLKTTGTLGDGTGLWQAPNSLASNSSGFSGLPGGYRPIFFDVVVYANKGFYGYWWSSSETSATKAWLRGLSYDDGYLFSPNEEKQAGFSVRCLLD